MTFRYSSEHVERIKEKNMKLRFMAAIGLLLSSSNVFAQSELKQNEVCHVEEINEAVSCKNDQVLMLTPSIYGNEQLPIYVAGLFCDFRHPIVASTAGVSCIFTDLRKEQW